MGKKNTSSLGAQAGKEKFSAYREVIPNGARNEVDEERNEGAAGVDGADALSLRGLENLLSAAVG